jgi:glucokinase
MDSVDFLIKDLEIELEKLKIRKRSIRAIGLAIAANVTRDGRILGSTNLHINLSGMTEALSRHFDCPVKAANDADMAALGECYRGASRDAGSSVMFTLGTGVGSGIVSGKKVLSGAHAAAGEAGHIHIQEDEPRECGCGNHGCIEQYVSASGITAVAEEMLSESDRPSMMRGRKSLDPVIIFSCADLGDEIALKTVDFMCSRVGWLCASVSSIVDPEIIVLGGGVSLAGKLLVNGTRYYFRKYSYNLCRDTKIELSGLGTYAGAYGAAVLASKKDEDVFIF